MSEWVDGWKLFMHNAPVTPCKALLLGTIEGGTYLQFARWRIGFCGEALSLIVVDEAAGGHLGLHIPALRRQGAHDRPLEHRRLHQPLKSEATWVHERSCWLHGW